MNAQDWLPVLVVGALMGAAGQGARVVVGIKKLNDEASAKDASVRSLVVPSQLVTSLLIGAIAGILGIVSTGVDLNDLKLKDMMTLLFIGYAGTDFIEGIIRREAPRETMPAVTPPTAPQVPQVTVLSSPLGPGPQIVVPNPIADDKAVG